MKLFTGLLILFFTVRMSFCSIQNLSGKLISFFLDEDTLSFYLEDPAPPSEDLRELLFKDQPPSSSITMIVDGKPYRLSEIVGSSAVKAERIGDCSLSYNFKVSSIFFRIIFLITNLENLSNNSIVCLIHLRNDGTNNSSVGAKFLFDTVYGENIRKPALYISDREKIEYDRLFGIENLPQFVFSGLYNSDLPSFGKGLFIYPYLNGQKPEKLIIGNWKKLNDNELSYKIEPQSHFRYYIYSDPDAAVAVYFNNINLKTGEETNFGTVLSVNKLSPVFITYDQKNRTNIPDNILNTNAAGLIPGDSASLKREIDILEKLSTVIDRLNFLISNGEFQIKGTQENSNFEKGLEKSVHEPVNETGHPLSNVETSESLKTNIARLEQQYNDKIAELKNYYDSLIRKREDENRQTSGSDKQRLKKIENVDKAISQINKKISAIEELLEMNHDFENLPAEKIDEIELKIKDIENKLD